MKNLGLFCLLLACIGLQSCKKNENPKDVEATKAKAEKPISVACYKALYENDTIELKINTLKNEKITGDMVMKIMDMPVKTGKISGSFMEIPYLSTTRLFKEPMIKKYSKTQWQC